VRKTILLLLLFLPFQCNSQVLKESSKVSLKNSSTLPLNFYEFSPGQMITGFYEPSSKKLRVAQYNKGDTLFSAVSDPLPGTLVPPPSACCDFTDPVPIARILGNSVGLMAWNSYIYLVQGSFTGVAPSNLGFQNYIDISKTLPGQFDTKFGNVSIACVIVNTGYPCAFAWTDTNNASIPGNCGAQFCPGNGYIHVLTTTAKENFSDSSNYALWGSGDSSIWTPAVAFVGQRLYVAWIGHDGNRLLNIAYSDDYHNFTKLTEPSNRGRQLSLANANGHLVLGFIGDDGQINLQIWNSPNITAKPDLQAFISPSGTTADTERSSGDAVSLSSTDEGLIVSWQQPKDTTNLAWINIPGARKVAPRTEHH
jgi:hypothetical protein